MEEVFSKQRMEKANIELWQDELNAPIVQRTGLRFIAVNNIPEVI